MNQKKAKAIRRRAKALIDYKVMTERTEQEFDKLVADMKKIYYRGVKK